MSINHGNILLEPLAQSFIVPERMVLTSVDLYFSVKDLSLPVSVSIRKMSDGVPSNYIMPFSEKYVYPDTINISPDGSTPTNIAFPSPLFIEPGEYALCIKSNSINYRLLVSEVGKVDDFTGNIIDSDPFTGELFAANNSNEWKTIQGTDLTFKLYQAEFDTTTSANLTFRTGSLLGLSKNLPTDPFEVFPNSDLMRVYHPNHGFSDGSFVVIEGHTGRQIGSIDFTPVANTTEFTQSSPIIGTHAVSNVTSNTYCITLPSTLTGISSSVRFGGEQVRIATDFEYHTLYPSIGRIAPPGTTITASYIGTDGTYTRGQETPIQIEEDLELNTPGIIATDKNEELLMGGLESLEFKVNLNTDVGAIAPFIDLDMIDLVAVRNLVDNPTYETENNLPYDIVDIFTGENTTFTRTSKYYGVLDIPVAFRPNILTLEIGKAVKLNSALNTGKYRISSISDTGDEIVLQSIDYKEVVTETANFDLEYGRNFIPEEHNTNGAAYSKYVTRQLDFLNLSTSLNFRIDALRPPGSDIEFYYKTLQAGEEELLEDKPYQKIEGISVPTSLDGSFVEVGTEIDNIPAFESLVLKIVFKSNSGSIVPKCKKLRLIALA